jgi:Fur family peroxide stress response transcriptional regulator
LPVTPVEAARRTSALSTALRAGGRRLTQQRLEVVREIAGTDEHPDAETIYHRVRERVPTISLDTVYRSLAALADLGLIRRVTELAGPARYDANVARHHHFVCTRCGLVADIEGAALDAWTPTARVPVPGTIESIEVQFRGICTRCRAEGAAPAGSRRPRRAPSREQATSKRKEHPHG